MKKKYVALPVFILILLTVCSVCAADHLASVKKDGVLRFGTSADYVPFVYYDGDDLVGIDVDLVKEIGRRMGVEVKVIDIAFDGLLESAQVDQVDLIGGAISITDERKKDADFTRAYYRGAGVTVAESGAVFTVENYSESLAKAKIGVQKGTSFDQWIKTNLVSTGAVNTQNVFTYSDIDAVMTALDRGNIDLAIMDKDVYDTEYRGTNKYKIVNTNSVEENYAFASFKGSTLIPEVDHILNAMMADGTAQKIANKYFLLSYDKDISASTTRPAQSVIVDGAVTNVEQIKPVLDATPVPDPAVQPANCLNAMLFMADIETPDGTVEAAGAEFRKIWRVYNNGSCTWDNTYSFAYVSGDYLSADAVPVTTDTEPGQSLDITVEMTAPAGDGNYRSNWQMVAPNGQKFGQTVWASIVVSGGGADTGMESGEKPVIYQFEPEKYVGSLTDCPRVHYDTRNADEISFYINNQLVKSTTTMSGVTDICVKQSLGEYNIGIVATGPAGTSSYAFKYVNTGQRAAK